MLHYKVKSKSWDDVWEGDFDELLEHNPDLPHELRESLRALQPGASLDCVVLGVTYTVSCREMPSSSDASEVSDQESMARAVEALLAELRQRGVWPSDIEVDLSGYETYRAAHPREDA